jgi:molybdopterin-guanine dinucleotide biosynthesis protein A
VRSAVILVGGEARRANGQEKYLFRYRGKPFIELLIGALRHVTDEIVLVARDPAQCERFSDMEGIRCTSDIRKGIGPLGGLHAGSLAAKGELLFVSACDMPCVNPVVVRYLFDRAEGYDAVIPCWNPAMFEPLHAVYRREAIIRYLRQPAALSLRDMIRSMRVRFVPVDELRPLDPGLHTFTNINRLDELERLSECDQPDAS